MLIEDFRSFALVSRLWKAFVSKTTAAYLANKSKSEMLIVVCVTFFSSLANI